MGYFAILHATNAQPFKVLACHLNFWLLSGFPSNQFFFDVGLQLEAEDTPVTDFELAIPFRTEDPYALSDLTNEMKSVETAELIFGTAVQVDHPNGKLTFEKRKQQQVLTLLSVNSGTGDQASKAIDSGADFTVWSIKFASAIPVGEKRYVRFRFRVSGLGRTWQWGSYSALFNFRVDDIREAVGAKKLNDRKDRILSIERFHLFLVAPAELEPVEIQPKLRYARLFEGETWEPYLRRHVHCPLLWWQKPKLVIYQWTNVSADESPQIMSPAPPGAGPPPLACAAQVPANGPQFAPVSKERPFKAYAQLRSWPPRLPSRWVLLLLLVAVILLYPQLMTVGEVVRNWFAELLGSAVNLILLLGALAVAKPVMGFLGYLPKIARVSRWTVRNLDRLLFCDWQ